MTLFSYHLYYKRVTLGENLALSRWVYTGILRKTQSAIYPINFLLLNFVTERSYLIIPEGSRCVTRTTTRYWYFQLRWWRFSNHRVLQTDGEARGEVSTSAFVLPLTRWSSYIVPLMLHSPPSMGVRYHCNHFLYLSPTSEAYVVHGSYIVTTLGSYADTCQSRISAHLPGRSSEICSTSLSPRPDKHWKGKHVGSEIMIKNWLYAQ